VAAATTKDCFTRLLGSVRHRSPRVREAVSAMRADRGGDDIAAKHGILSDEDQRQCGSMPANWFVGLEAPMDHGSTP
jgi:hypothetical protein